MRITELRSRMSDYFSDSDTYARDIVHAELGGVTVNQALERGDEGSCCPQSGDAR